MIQSFQRLYEIKLPNSEYKMVWVTEECLLKTQEGNRLLIVNDQSNDQDDWSLDLRTNWMGMGEPTDALNRCWAREAKRKEHFVCTVGIRHRKRLTQ